MRALALIILTATELSIAQHDGFNIAPPVIHSGIVFPYKRDFRAIPSYVSFDQPQQQPSFPQYTPQGNFPTLQQPFGQQQNYQVSGSVQTGQQQAPLFNQPQTFPNYAQQVSNSIPQPQQLPQMQYNNFAHQQPTYSQPSFLQQSQPSISYQQQVIASKPQANPAWIPQQQQQPQTYSNPAYSSQFVMQQQQPANSFQPQFPAYQPPPQTFSVSSPSYSVSSSSTNFHLQPPAGPISPFLPQHHQPSPAYNPAPVSGPQGPPITVHTVSQGQHISPPAPPPVYEPSTVSPHQRTIIHTTTAVPTTAQTPTHHVHINRPSSGHETFRSTPPPPPDRFVPHPEDLRDPLAAASATSRPLPIPANVNTTTIVVENTNYESAKEGHNRGQTSKKSHISKKKRIHMRTRPTSAPSTATSIAVLHPRPFIRIIPAPFPPAPVISTAPAISATRAPAIRPRPKITEAPPPPQTRPPPPPPRPSPAPVTVHKVSPKPSQLLSHVETASAASKHERDPDEVFLQCCRDSGIDAKCHSKCSFSTLSKKALTGMFLGTDPCPQTNGRGMLGCAAQNKDHSACCIERGVHTTAAKDKCLGFCRLTPGAQLKADISLLPCWAVLNDIKGCFEDDILGI